MFVQLELQLISVISIRIYSEASIAENPLLAAGGEFKDLNKSFLVCCCIGTLNDSVMVLS
jgi:hypothetical protein